MNAKEKRYKMGKERIVFVDYARALGIFLVVFAHCLQKYCDGMDFSNHFIYSFHMPLFFVISGFLLSLKDVKIEKLPRTAKRLLGPYFFLERILCPFDVRAILSSTLP